MLSDNKISLSSTVSVTISNLLTDKVLTKKITHF